MKKWLKIVLGLAATMLLMAPGALSALVVTLILSAFNQIGKGYQDTILIFSALSFTFTIPITLGCCWSLYSANYPTIACIWLISYLSIILANIIFDLYRRRNGF